MTDLQKFIELYKSIGIDLIVNKEENTQEIILFSENINGANNFTYSEKFEGYSSFYSIITFDLKGKFIKQGFWE